MMRLLADKWDEFFALSAVVIAVLLSPAHRRGDVTVLDRLVDLLGGRRG